jgi:AbrB family looped-hinge helix DNA binding protein
MEVEIDDYGRIVIPKEVRDHLGIDSGTALKLTSPPAEARGILPHGKVKVRGWRV